MKALILAADGVEDCELLYPMYRLREHGAEVHVAAAETGPLTGKHGYTIEATHAFAEVDAGDYDLLLLPGGKAPESVRLDEKAVTVTREFLEADKAVAAICHGMQVLISADGVRGKKATCWAGIRDDAKAAGADYSDQPVVVDGRLVTSRCPDDLPDFMNAIFGVLQAETRGAEASEAAVNW